LQPFEAAGVEHHPLADRPVGHAVFADQCPDQARVAADLKTYLFERVEGFPRFEFHGLIPPGVSSHN
jgi:hypothetical protein